MSTVQDPNDILSAITTLAQTVGNTPVAAATIPTLNFTAPGAGAIDDKFMEFLNRAKNDPDIIAYYKQILDYAQGDTNLAKQQIENDYKVGVRQTTDTLGSTLEQLGLTFGKEEQSLENTLNQRGIAMTDMGGGKTAYAAGGQPASELSQLNESQKLRQEAEQRSASQKIEGLGISREKGLTGAGQSLRNTALDLQERQKQDVYNRANVNYGAWQGKQVTDAQKALQNQQDRGGKQSVDKSATNPATGKAYAVNPTSGVWDDNYFAQTYG